MTSRPRSGNLKRAIVAALDKMAVSDVRDQPASLQTVIRRMWGGNVFALFVCWPREVGAHTVRLHVVGHHAGGCIQGISIQWPLTGPSPPPLYKGVPYSNPPLHRTPPLSVQEGSIQCPHSPSFISSRTVTRHTVCFLRSRRRTVSFLSDQSI